MHNTTSSPKVPSVPYHFHAHCRVNAGQVVTVKCQWPFHPQNTVSNLFLKNIKIYLKNTKDMNLLGLERLVIKILHHPFVIITLKNMIEFSIRPYQVFDSLAFYCFLSKHARK